tara:strand:- start:3105 stop:4082 length:978 start_codon:yes stop_codon:yes gene_type:complete
MKIKYVNLFYTENCIASKNKAYPLDCLYESCDKFNINSNKRGCPRQYISGFNLLAKRNDFLTKKNEYAVLVGYQTDREKVTKKVFQENIFFLEPMILNDYHIQRDKIELKNYWNKILLGSVFDGLSKPIHISKKIYKTKYEDFYKCFKFNIKSYKKTGEKILILGNKQKGFGTEHIDGNAIGWIENKIIEIRGAGIKNEILIRFHPAMNYDDEAFAQTMSKKYNNVKRDVDRKSSILQSINKKDIKCAITYNSSAIVPCILEGIPSMIDFEHHISKKYANINTISEINNPNFKIDRELLIEKIINYSWNRQHMSNGLVWEAYLQN